MQHTPLFAQVLFFGAVLSAIMSCSSATLLAPSVTFAENVVKGFYPRHGRPPFPARDARHHGRLRRHRAGLVALNTEASIFKMVENAYKVTLAGAFVPLFFGIFWKRATTQGALAAIIGGLGSLGADRGADRRSQPGAAATDRPGVSRRHGGGLAAAAVVRRTVSARNPDSSQKKISAPSAFACLAMAGKVSRCHFSMASGSR
jgi:hypothetical protein